MLGKRVLITGAGGTIGSALARRCCELGAAHVALLERSEGALFEVNRQLQDDWAGVVEPVVCDVTDAPRVHANIYLQRPDVIFHTAAHKHVPLMQEHPWEALNNNVGGTRTVMSRISAWRDWDMKAILISTDKAADPVCVMGATKYLAERVAMYYGGHAVRFGNVVGSSNSVFDIWRKQIGEGKPITITDPTMTRYQMTTRQAVDLVLKVSGLDPGCYALDMGEPVTLGELLKVFLMRTGRKDWPVETIGPRPGERHHEQIVGANESLHMTDIPGVNRIQPHQGLHVLQMIHDLDRAIGSADDDEALRMIRRWVGTMKLEGAAA